MIRHTGRQKCTSKICSVSRAMSQGQFMSHCIIEHSETINGHILIPLVFVGAVNSKLFDVTGNDIKVRALPFDKYQTGSQI